jgi:hypothetical protein
MARARVLGIGLVALALSACSHFSQLAAGPATAIEDGSPPAWGGAVIGETVVGKSSPGGAFGGLGVGARGLVTPRAVDAAPFVGAHVGSSGERTFLDGSVRFGPGIQLREGSPLGFLGLGASVGLGYTLSDTGWIQQAPISAPPEIERRMPAGGPDVLALRQAEDLRRRRERERRRLLLTVGLAADVDVRFTRAPMLTLGFLVGVAWLDEIARF